MPDIKMLPGELQELVSDVARVKLQDFHLGRVLEKFVTHLAHAHGLDTTEIRASETGESEPVASEPADDVADGEESGDATPQKPSKGKK